MAKLQRKIENQAAMVIIAAILLIILSEII